MAGPSNNGGWSPDDLPDLPEEWGVIVIPDDLSELSDEVAAIQAELRETAQRSRWRRFADRPLVHQVRVLTNGAIRAPALIISLAVLVTVASLFASAWPGPARQSTIPRIAATTTSRVETLPAIEVVDAYGQPVSLRREVPAVLMLIGGCECDMLIADTLAAVRPEVLVITVSDTPPPWSGIGSPTVPQAGADPQAGANPQAGSDPPGAPQPQGGAATRAEGTMMQGLYDPSGTLRGQLNLGAADGTAAVLLVDETGNIIYTTDHADSVEAFRSALVEL